MKPACTGKLFHARPPMPAGAAELQRTQKIQQILLLLSVEALEVANHAIRFGTLAGVFPNGIQQVRGATVVQEENALPESPQWRGAKLVRSRRTLRHAVRKIRSHVVYQQIRK